MEAPLWYFVLYVAFALWVLQDGISRKMGSAVGGWVLGTLILGPVILPMYLAKRPLKKGEVREGGTSWNVLKNFAILWTVLMAVASFYALKGMAQVATGLDNDAARAGAGLGMLFGLGILAVVWLLPTLGAAILGFMLKKNSIIETGPTGPLVGNDTPAGFANGWGGLAITAILALIVGIAWNASATKPSVAAKASTSASPAVSSVSSLASEATKHIWEMNETSDRMDGSKETTLSLTSEDKVDGFVGSHSAYLVVRCRKSRPEVFVSLGVPVEVEYGSDSNAVRLKFDDEAPVRSRWNPSTDREALFAPAPAKVVKQLEQAKILLFEFTPFQKRATSVKFNVAGLRDKMPALGGSCGSL